MFFLRISAAFGNSWALESDKNSVMAVVPTLLEIPETGGELLSKTCPKHQSVFTGVTDEERLRRQMACKPGSVLRALASIEAMTIHLGRLSPGASRDRPGWRSENGPGQQADPPPLLGLAPGGVYRAVPVTSDAVRSYRTLSPLPEINQAVCFLWHFPWGRPRRALPGTVSPWSPDFPRLVLIRRRTSRGHPANWRRAIGNPAGIWGQACRSVRFLLVARTACKTARVSRSAIPST